MAVSKRAAKSFAKPAAAVKTNSNAIPTPFTTAPAALQPLLPQLDPSKVHLIHIDRHTPDHKKQIVRLSILPIPPNNQLTPNQTTVPNPPHPQHPRRPLPPLPRLHRRPLLLQPPPHHHRRHHQPHNPQPSHRNPARNPHGHPHPLRNPPRRLPRPALPRPLAARLLPRAAFKPDRLALAAGRLPARRSHRAGESELGR